MMNIFVELLVPFQSSQSDIQIVRMRNVGYVTETCLYMFDVYFGCIWLRAELLIIVYQDVSALNDVVLLFSPVVAIEEEPIVFFIIPYKLIFIYQLARYHIL